MNDTSPAPGFNFATIKDQALQVITKPADFYRTLPPMGGLRDPILFVLVVSILSGAIRAATMLTTSFAASIGTLVMTPVFALLGSFISAALIWLIWILLGTTYGYQTAYRCTAYASAIVPITTVLSFIPYVGGLIGVAWGMYLMFVASVEVHKIPRQKAAIAWGILFVLLGIWSVWAESTSREFSARLENMEQQMQSEDMTPEEAGRMVGEFMKGLEKAAQQPEPQP